MQSNCIKKNGSLIQFKILELKQQYRTNQRMGGKNECQMTGFKGVLTSLPPLCSLSVLFIPEPYTDTVMLLSLGAGQHQLNRNVISRVIFL